MLEEEEDEEVLATKFIMGSIFFSSSFNCLQGDSTTAGQFLVLASRLGLGAMLVHALAVARSRFSPATVRETAFFDSFSFLSLTSFS